MKIKVYDIECYKVWFYIFLYDPDTKKEYSFEISKWKNQLYELVSFIESCKSDDYWVGYNNVNYDFQVIQYIIDNYNNWHEREDIYSLIYDFSKWTISETDNGGFPKYRESSFSIPQIDLFKINHFDNKNKYTSLKWIQYMTNWPNLETMPHDFDDENLTQEQLIQDALYCRNDALSTYHFYLYTTGQVDHKFYKDNNKIQNRIDIYKEGLLPKEVINYSDVKIGDELNKKKYIERRGIELSDIYKLKRNRKPTKSFTFGDAIPDYVKFQTPELIEFYNKIKKEKVSLIQGDKTQYLCEFRGTTYSIMRGGIHSVDESRVIIPKEDEYLEDSDVGAQYPNAIDKRGLYPFHLGKEWTGVMRDTILQKDNYKQQGKKAQNKADKNRLKGLETMTKYQMNGGGFGKTLETDNWQYAPEVGYYCTIGNQFEILMLIEMLEMEGIHIISANTDGILALYKKSLGEKHKEICNKWEEIVGNNIRGKLEHTLFKALYSESVNHYIAIKEDGEVKIKGRFEIYGELSKNNSDKISRIERLAIQEYFAKGIPIDKTIKECKDLTMFLIGKKANRNYRWETLSRDGTREQYRSVIRFYISKNGKTLLKMKNIEADTKGAKVTKFFNGKKVTMCNKLPSEFPNDIDYSYYIDNIIPVIKGIEKDIKIEKFSSNPQMSLF